MPLTLGTPPDRLDVVLVPGADFVESVETLNADMSGPQPWPVGTVLTLVFGDGPTITWTASVNTNIVSWNVQSEQVDAVILAGHRTARLWYENGAVKVPLATGEVSVYG